MKRSNPLIPMLLFIALALLTSNCKNNNDDVKFEMAYVADFNIPAGINPFEAHYFYIRDIPIGSYLSANNISASDLMAINPGSARFSTLFSGSGEYDFIREASIRIYTEDEDNWKEVFWRTEVPFNTGEDLDIIPTLVDAKQYFENTKFNIIVRLDLRAAPQQTLETKLNISFLAK